MAPFIFWVLGVFSAAAALFSVVHPRPVRCAQGLLGLMAANCAILFLLSSPLLACELMLVTVGGALLVRFFLGRREIMKLGVPGLARLSWARVLAVVTVLLLFAVLWPVLAKPHAIGTPPIPAARQASFWAWMALFLIGSSVGTAWLVISAKRREPPQDGGEAPR